MWSYGWAGIAGGGPSRSRAAQVLGLEHLAEPLGPPVGDEELQPGPGAQPAVAVVAEDADDAGPDVGHLVDRHPGAEPLGEHRVGRQPAADPQVEAGTVLRVDDADEGDVVAPRATTSGSHATAVLNLRGRLENSGEPMYRRWISSIARRRVEHLGGRDSGHRASRAPPAGCRRTPRWWTGRRPPAAARSPEHPRPGSSATGRSAGR